MPRIESELRSRDLIQLLAEPTITEEAPPTEIGVEVVRLVGQSDAVTLIESRGTAILGPRYYVPARNLLVNSQFIIDLGAWTSEFSTHHLGAQEWNTEYVNVPRQTTTSAFLEIIVSAAAGDSMLWQEISVASGDPFSFEAWLRIVNLTGTAQAGLEVTFRQADSTIISTHTLMGLTSATAEFMLIGVTGLVVPSMAITARCAIIIRSLTMGDAITVYATNCRAAHEASFLTWQIRAVAGEHAASTVGNLIPSLAQIPTQQGQVGQLLTPFILPAAIGGNPPFTYSIMNLPDGLVFDSMTRQISGTPSTVQLNVVSYQVEDVDGDVYTEVFAFTITLAPQAPIAVAGAAQSVTAGASVTLDGTGSSDPDGTIVTYVWTQTAGDSVTLTGADTASPSFVAPSTSSAQILTFQLIVTDDDGDMDMDTVNISVAAESAAFIVTLTAITSTPVALVDTYGLGERVHITVTYNGSVDVDITNGVPYLQANFTNGSRSFDYVSGLGSTMIVFEYVVASGDVDTNGIFLFGATDAQNRGVIVLNGGTIRNAGTTIDADLVTTNRGTQGEHHVDGSLGAVSAPSFAGSTGDAQNWTENQAITPITVPTASGAPAPTYVVVGTLPAGIQFNSTNRVISGTPTVSDSGTITIRATNSEGFDDWTVAYTTTAALSAPLFSTDSGPAQTWTVGTAITLITVPAATGHPAPTYAVVGSLPGGLSFDTTTRVLSGVPTVTGAGTIQIRAINSEGFDDWTVAYTTTAMPIPLNATRFDSLAILDSLFHRADSGSSAGAWLRDTAGSTPSPSTGPGSNSEGPYIFSESTGSDITLPDVSTLTVLVSVMATWTGLGRTLLLRACIQGDGTYPNDSASGLQIQGRDSDSDAWTVIDLLEGWAYNDSLTPGDTVTDSRGIDRVIAQAGGWVDFTLTIPDTYTQLRIRNIPAMVGPSFRHDAAMWHIELRDGIV